MRTWRDIKIEVKHQQQDKPVYSQLTEAESSRKALEAMQRHFRTPETARDAHDAYRAWRKGKALETPEAASWGQFRDAIKDMEERHAHIGIDHARVTRVDFSDLSRDIEIEHEMEIEIDR